MKTFLTMKTFLRYGSLVPIGLLSWLITSSLLAQQPSRPTPNRIALEDEDENLVLEVAEPFTEPVVDAELPQARRQAPRAADASVATFQFKAVDVKAANGVAKVNAQVSLSSKRTDIRYIWRLSLLDGKGKTLDTLLYDRQVFGMETPGTIEPTFGEIVNLVPGAKMVQLSLYTCAQGTNPATFMDDEKANGLLALRYVKRL